ncbi:hypothetical protein B0J11DRAFT_74339 [Dendryphion nanum]|uniref:Zn(2)-C6 fungal-type domain-containing protein n=1 Tax=Dendryphion nanum TaxID=256645 RepID=A0A9P9DDY0_9PLEO|nr:hypothetical protein B0J11DRAFT_74339 [Dendryphion nanum]
MDGHLQCHICSKTFTQKSSLVRHSKRCTPGPAPSLRQKSCRQCTGSKTKCDLQRPRCGRCKQRDTPCEYFTPMTRGTRRTPRPPQDSGESLDSLHFFSGSSSPEASNADIPPVSFADVPQGLLSTDMELNLNSPFAPFVFSDTSATMPAPITDFLVDKDQLDRLDWLSETPPTSLNTRSEFDVISGIDSPHSSPDGDNFGSNDWLLWNQGPLQTTPPLVRHSMETLLRVMKTWPGMLAKEFQAPPILHFSHSNLDTRLPPMANCITVAKMWANQAEGETELIRQVIIQEMRVLFEQHRSFDERHLLSALQALVLYTIMLMFSSRNQISVSLVDPAIFMCLQRVASYIARTGLMLTEEQNNRRPSWDSWIHVTGKRRAVFSLYLLHWSYSVYHGLQSFACSQLGYLPAPAPKFLWQAESKEKWENLYTRWLNQWGDCPYKMCEFAAIQSGPSLERRTEIWLEDADELGVLFFAIGTTVHPCVAWW